MLIHFYFPSLVCPSSVPPPFFSLWPRVPASSHTGGEPQLLWHWICHFAFLSGINFNTQRQDLSYLEEGFLDCEHLEQSSISVDSILWWKSWPWLSVIIWIKGYDLARGPPSVYWVCRETPGTWGLGPDLTVCNPYMLRSDAGQCGALRMKLILVFPFSLVLNDVHSLTLHHHTGEKKNLSFCGLTCLCHVRKTDWVSTWDLSQMWSYCFMDTKSK